MSITRATMIASVGLAVFAPGISAGQGQTPGGTEQAPETGPSTTGTVAGTVQVRPEIRSITVTPSSIALSDCGGESTVLTLPGGTCSSGEQRITVTNLGTAASVFVAATSLRGQNSNWRLCGNPRERCYGRSSSQPGGEEAALRLSEETGPAYWLRTASEMDPHFGTNEPNASRGESHAYRLSVTAPTTSTSTAVTRTFSVTWTLRPAPPV